MGDSSAGEEGKSCCCGRKDERPDLAAGQYRERCCLSTMNGCGAERLTHWRQRTFHHRMGGDGEDEQDEQGAQITCAEQHRKARNAASRQHHSGAE